MPDKPVYKVGFYRDETEMATYANSMYKEGYKLHSWNYAQSVFAKCTAVFVLKEMV